MLQEYERTGYVWEQYDALTGEGKRRWVVRILSPIRYPNDICSHPFTGWTSLTALSEFLLMFI